MSGTLAAAIVAQLDLRPFRDFPELVAYQASPGSNLRRLTRSGVAPYWAYAWAGGAALAKFIADNPELVKDRHVMDYGAGSGLAGMAAARGGARAVHFVERAEAGRAAIGLNCAANGIMPASIKSRRSDALLARSDLILAGDVFYAAPAARMSLRLIAAAQERSVPVLVGDPGRRHLPGAGWTICARYLVHDFGLRDPIEAAVYEVVPLPGP